MWPFVMSFKYHHWINIICYNKASKHGLQLLFLNKQHYRLHEGRKLYFFVCFGNCCTLTTKSSACLRVHWFNKYSEVWIVRGAPRRKLIIKFQELPGTALSPMMQSKSQVLPSRHSLTRRGPKLLSHILVLSSSKHAM